MAKPRHVLIVWELGAQLGHVLSIRGLVLELLSRGNRVTIVCPHLEFVRPQIPAHANLSWLKCPEAFSQATSAPTSYAEMLKNCIFTNEASTNRMMGQWHQLIARTRPDIMSVEYAPMALLMARMYAIPVIHLAWGWGAPATYGKTLKGAVLPILGPVANRDTEALATKAEAIEAELVQRINAHLKRANAALLEKLSDLYQAELSLLATFPEFDHFAGRSQARYVGALFELSHGLKLQWPPAPEEGPRLRPRVLIYLQPHPNNHFALKALQSLGADVIAYLPKVADKARAALHCESLQIVQEPISLDLILRHADLVISNGGHGLLCASLLAGVPLMVCPSQEEQGRLAERARRTGAVHIVDSDSFVQEFLPAARTLLTDPSAKKAASRFAAKYRAYDQSSILIKLANTIERLSERAAAADLPAAYSRLPEVVAQAQIEITTKCNFECFYCAGRHMDQANMSWEKFQDVLSQLGPIPTKVSLQGEGEPTAHPQFWDMVDRLIALGHEPYTITNGSLIDAKKAAGKFPTIGVSLDTLDEVEAQRIGRYKLPKVLQHIADLVREMGPSRLRIHTVDYGQPLEATHHFVAVMGVTHLVQKIQAKQDYAKHYECVIPVFKYARSCAYLEDQKLRYFDVQGREAPCCYIKDMTHFTSPETMRADLMRGRVPSTCLGCREIATPVDFSVNAKQENLMAVAP